MLKVMTTIFITLETLRYLIHLCRNFCCVFSIKTCKRKLCFHFEVKRDLITILRDLLDDKLLKKYAQGKTKNNNRSLNGLIWKKCQELGGKTRCILCSFRV